MAQRALAGGNPLLRHELAAPYRWLRRMGRTSLKRALVLLLLGLAYDAAVGVVCWGALERDWRVGIEPLVFCVFAVLALVTPGIAATAIASERQRGSWDMLAVTRLTRRQLMDGKWAGRLGWIGFVVLLALPFLAVPIISDSVDLRGYWVAIPVLGLMVLGLSGLGMVCSAKAKSVAAAAGWTYGLTALLLVGVPTIDVMVLEFGHLTDDPIAMMVTCPFFTWAGITALICDNHWFDQQSQVWSCAGPVFYLLLSYLCYRWLLGSGRWLATESR